MMSRGRLFVLGLIVCMALALGRQVSDTLAQPRPGVAAPAAFAPDLAPAWLTRLVADDRRWTMDDGRQVASPRQGMTEVERQGAASSQGLPDNQQSITIPLPSPVTNHPSSITPPNPHSPIPNLQSSRTATVTADALNVRAGPGTRFEVISLVYSGDHLMLLSDPGAWPRVRTPSGVVGYVSADYISLDEATAAQDTPPGAPSGPGLRNPFGRSPAPGSSGPPGNPPGGPAGSPWGRSSGGRQTPNTQLGEAVTDEAGNNVRVANRTGGVYTFDTDQLLKLLRDEGVTGETVTISLVASEYGNRSSTTWGSLTIDCNPITVPVESGRPNPPGNGKTGAAFCNAVALHEVYHLIQLHVSGWGGTEPDADAFAARQLKRYTLVR